MPLVALAGSLAYFAVLAAFFGFEDSFVDLLIGLVYFASFTILVGASCLISNLLGVAHKVLFNFFFRNGLKFGPAWLKVNMPAYLEDCGRIEENGLPGGVDLIKEEVGWIGSAGFGMDLSLFWNFFGFGSGSAADSGFSTGLV